LNQNASPQDNDFGTPRAAWRHKLYVIIFEADTPAGKWFDLILIAAVLLSVVTVILDSVASIASQYQSTLNILEWFFTILFTIEYIARLSCVRHPTRYARSFFGIIDLLTILPSYLELFLPGAHFLTDVRLLRLLRIFRILKLVSFINEYRQLGSALAASRRKIMIFLSVVLIVTFLLGTLMYAVEGSANGFTSIPVSVYWAITTITTVGFGDISPKTDLGRFITSLMMLLGWGILAVPTGIISAEISAQKTKPTTRTCPSCLIEGLDEDAKYCKNCGATLPPYEHN
jgi:voltage-gated potassium channel